MLEQSMEQLLGELQELEYATQPFILVPKLTSMGKQWMRDIHMGTGQKKWDAINRLMTGWSQRSLLRILLEDTVIEKERIPLMITLTSGHKKYSFWRQLRVFYGRPLEMTPGYVSAKENLYFGVVGASSVVQDICDHLTEEMDELESPVPGVQIWNHLYHPRHMAQPA